MHCFLFRPTKCVHWCLLVNIFEKRTVNFAFSSWPHPGTLLPPRPSSTSVTHTVAHLWRWKSLLMWLPGSASLPSLPSGHRLELTSPLHSVPPRESVWPHRRSAPPFKFPHWEGAFILTLVQKWDCIACLAAISTWCVSTSFVSKSVLCFWPCGWIKPTSCFFLLVFSNDEDEDQQSTDTESKEKGKDKKTLCKVKWSRDEVSLLKLHFVFRTLEIFLRFSSQFIF